MTLTRRDFLQTSAAAAAGALLASCTGSPPPLPDLTAHVERIKTHWPIKRVVYLMLENRSFDHLFGKFPGANGATTGLLDGREVPLAPAAQWTLGDLPHDFGAYQRHVNGGQMDGFHDTAPETVFAYTQFGEEDLPSYWHYAREYVLCDNVFASAFGNSYPNHLYMVAGQAGGAWDAPQQSPKVRHKRSRQGLAKTWGCDVPEGGYLLVSDTGPEQDQRVVDPCLSIQSQPDLLEREHVEWAYYGADERQVGYIWNSFAAIHDVFHDRSRWRHHIRSVDRLLHDIRAGALPSVTWVTPRYELSNHPPWSTCFSHNWVTMVIDTIMRSDMWKHTAVFLTWDEWGGFYDHAVPPTIDEWGLGIRVPMLVISPYAKRGMIDTEQGEFSTPLRFISDNFGTPYLTDRVRDAHNFEHVFDFGAKQRPPSPSRARVQCRGDWRHALRDTEDWSRLPGFDQLPPPSE